MYVYLTPHAGRTGHMRTVLNGGRNARDARVHTQNLTVRGRRNQKGAERITRLAQILLEERKNTETYRRYSQSRSDFLFYILICAVHCSPNGLTCSDPMKRRRGVPWARRSRDWRPPRPPTATRQTWHATSARRLRSISNA
jgi:hypothetical protein